MHVSLVQQFAAVAESAPHAPALAWRDVRWSYGDLHAAIDAVARRLTELASPRGARIALLFRNSPHYVALYYGVLAAGFVAVPLNSQERASVLARQIEHCGATLVIGDPEHPEWQLLARQLSVPTLAVKLEATPDALERFLSAMASPGEAVAYAPARDELATLIYTSGTTGRPKGVMLSHGNLMSNALSIIEYLQLTRADRGLCVLPFHFSYGNSVLHTHLLSGAYLSIEDNFAYPQATLQRLQDEAITGFSGVPSTFALLLGRCRLGDFELGRLRYVTQAGGPMPRALIEQLRELLPRTRLFVMYGQTEATARLSYLPPERLATKLGSIGVAIPGVTLVVRKDGTVAPPNTVGELTAQGPNVMLGYWDDPEATDRVLQAGWLHTGDLARCDEDGFLFIEGRSVDMIKVGAFRISPQEIEEVVASLAAVEETAVTGVPDEVLGQSVKACIVLKPGAELTIMEVKAHCRQHLAAYKVPKIVEFATALPRTASGKVQRFKLAHSVDA